MENGAGLSEPHIHREGGREAHEHDTPSPSYTHLVRFPSSSVSYRRREQQQEEAENPGWT
jgi:hypothetical protein